MSAENGKRAPHHHFGQHVLDEVGGCCAHSATHARRAEASALARERHEATFVARPAAKPCETSAEQPAVQVRLELLLRVFGQLDVERAVVDSGVECLEVVAHHFVEGRALGAVTFILTGVCSGG